MKRKILLIFLTIISSVCLCLSVSACDMLNDYLSSNSTDQSITQTSSSDDSTEQSSSGDDSTEDSSSGDDS